MTKEKTPKEATFEGEAVQFVRPNGRQHHGVVKLPVRCLGAFNTMRTLGYRLELEVIPGVPAQMICAAISSEDEDLTSILVPSNEKLPERIADMFIEWANTNPGEQPDDQG